MRTKSIMLLAMVLCSGELLAQSTEKKSSEKNTVKVHIEKTVDGKKTVIDTIFTSSDDSAYKTFMDQHEMEVEVEEGKGKDGKIIKKEVVVKYDSKKGNEEKKMILISPDGEAIPVPPTPPTPPTPPGVDDEVQAFNFNWTNDEDVKHEGNGSGDKVIKIRRMGDEKEFHFVMPDIDQYLNEGKSSKRSRKSKKAKKRIIIIEEY